MIHGVLVEAAFEVLDPLLKAVALLCELGDLAAAVSLRLGDPVGADGSEFAPLQVSEELVVLPHKGFHLGLQGLLLTLVLLVKPFDVLLETRVLRAQLLVRLVDFKRFLHLLLHLEAVLFELANDLLLRVAPRRRLLALLLELLLELLHLGGVIFLELPDLLVEACRALGVGGQTAMRLLVRRPRVFRGL